MDRHSIRLATYDYRMPGAYFVTVCTAPGVRLSRITGAASVVLGPFGQIVAEEWHRTAQVRPYMHLDAFVVMPDHVHGVVWIETGRGMACHALPTVGGTSRVGMARHAPTMRTFGQPPARALSSVVGAFKSGCARRINDLRGTPGAPFWQRNYYEHVVRNEADLARIRRYVAGNPARWVERHRPHPFTPPSMRPWM